MPNTGFGCTSSCCVAILPMVFRRRQRSETGELVSALVEKANEIHQRQFKRFSLKELLSATDNFNPRYMMGSGCFGTVYKGQLSDGSLVAIKRLTYYTQSEDNPFLTELEITGRAIHRNLLRLRGFCSTPREILLVYPLMVNGSVASYLGDRRENQHPLSWETRKRIALGAARGLEYLHDGCDSKIIHCDVKPGNILLDTKFEAVIGGLGSAKCMDHHDTHVTTGIRGTIGYIAPEFLLTGEASEKTDVFGYGIMLLELITRERAFDLARLANDDEVMLLDWVKRHLEEDNLERLVDANLQGGYVDDEAKQLIQLALLCTQSSAMERPKMSDVVRMLEGEGLDKRWQQWQQQELH